MAGLAALENAINRKQEDSSDDEDEEMIVFSKEDGDTEPAKVDQVGLLSYITYSWVFGYLWSAFRGLIRHDQAWAISHYDSALVNMTRLEILWKQELANPRRKGSPSLFRVVMIFFRTRLILACFVFMFCLAFGFIGPTCLVRALVHYSETSSTNLHYGLMLVASLFLVEMCRVLSYGASWAISYRSGIRVRSALLGLLFKKIVHLRSLGSKTTGQIVNMYANDGQRVFDAVTFAPLVITGPTVLFGGIVYLLFLLGPWSLLGVGVFFFFDVVQIFLGITMVRCRKRAIENTEKRIGLLTEVLRCIRLVKMNALELPFMERIFDLRNEEQSALRTAGYAQSLAIALGTCVPVVATIITFLAYFATGHNLLASEIFSAITVYFVMMFGIRMIPYGARYLAEALVSLRNMQEILMMAESENFRSSPTNKSLSIVLQDSTFTWQAAIDDKKTESVPLKESGPVLKAVTLTIEKKQLIGVCGAVGSGKSALLQALIGQLEQRDGNVLLSGSLAYAAQDPWIINASVRENITFGAPFEEQRYYRVLYACALNHDVNNMPAQDLTEIGERGVTLSGGQKARISVARALYASKDIYLLDDVTSALDQNVAEHVFRYAIKGLLQHKTVLTVTSSVNHLSQCDEVLYMDNGRVVDQGEHEQLLSRCTSYAQYCETACKRHAFKAEPRIENVLRPNVEEPREDDAHNPTAALPSETELDLMRRKVSISRSQSTLTGADSLFDIPEALEDDGILIKEEEDFGLAAVPLSIYAKYIQAAGGFVPVLFIVCAFFANVGSTVFSTVWLSEWIKQNAMQNGRINGSSSFAEDPYFSHYAWIYGATLVLLLVTGIVKALVFVKVTLNAASRLHNAMFTKVIRGAMSFFDSTPTGRILNRFSKDMDEIDVKLPFNMESFLQNMLMVVAYNIVIAYIFPYFLIGCIPLGVVFFILVASFRAGIRSLKRSEHVTRSPLFEHIESSIDGLATIHAFGENNRFTDLLRDRLDANSAAMFMFHSAMRWLAVWLDLLVVAITTLVALFLVLAGDTVPAAYAGMALTFAIQMSGIFQFAVRTQTELEAKMTSVERVQYYIDRVEDEGDWYGKTRTPPIDWPDKGRVSFRNVSLRYRENIALALKDVTLDILPREKIGIVGRTGSGKTSLSFALFRLYPLANGEISVDEIDLTEIGLHELRSKMASIPQDPQLFAGSVRFNLDPHRSHTDAQLWDALSSVHMKEMISGLPNGLDSEITESGGNMSAGERQLLCMARALLRKVKVLILDEATSSLDSGADQLIQRCIRTAFQDCTLLIIAHRLNSVQNVDRVLYMNNGKAIEFDQPETLLADPKSAFSVLMSKAQESGMIREDSEEISNTTDFKTDSDQIDCVE